MARIGQLKTITTCEIDGGVLNHIYNVYELEVDGRTLVCQTQQADDPNAGQLIWYSDLDLTDEDELNIAFPPQSWDGVATHEWIVPMTEVADSEVDIELPLSIAQGGTGATTVAEAIANLGAAAANHTHSGYAASSHTHNYAGSSSAGGAATSAVKLETARTISLTGDVTGSTSFDGTGNASITATVADDSHNHTIANVDGLQSALDGKSATSHKHYAQTITVAGEDLDTYMDAGIYTFAQAYAPSNPPAGTNGWLVVMPWSSSSNTIKQLWFRQGTANSNDFETYVRTKAGGTWSNWSKYYTTSNPPTASEVGAIPASLQMTADDGDVSISWSGKNVVTEFTNLASGMYTVYSPAGNTNNPNSSESFRFMVHKTGSEKYGWVMAYGAKGSIYTGYIDNGNWQGWKAIFEAAPQPLWTGAVYMTETHTITPSKTLSQCRNGWLLLWSDYDPGEGESNTDFYASVIFKRAYTGQTWAGGEWYCDIPSYSAGTATDSEQRVIKIVKVYDNKLVGTENNSVAPRNDVCLRAIYEF